MVSGGLAAVIYTDVLQTVVLLVGAIILAILGKTRSNMTNTFFYGLLSSAQCGTGRFPFQMALVVTQNLHVSSLLL